MGVLNVTKMNLLLDILLGGSAFINILVLILDYLTRNGGDPRLINFTNILFVVLLILLVLSIVAIIFFLLKTRANVRLITPLTLVFLLLVLVLVFATRPIEAWITTQSYTRGG